MKLMRLYGRPKSARANTPGRSDSEWPAVESAGRGVRLQFVVVVPHASVGPGRKRLGLSTRAPSVPTPKHGTTMSKQDETKILAFAEITSMPDGDQMALYKSMAALRTEVKEAQTEEKRHVKTAAKATAAMKRLYTKRLNSRDIPPDTSEKDFFSQNGGDVSARVRACAALFNALVLTLDALGNPLLKEEYFDAAADDWLEKGNAIIQASMKVSKDAWKTCDDVLDLVNALSKPGDALKAIKAIRSRQKGEDKEAAAPKAKDAPALTIGRAIEFLKAAIKDAAKLDAVEAERLYRACIEMGDAWAGAGIPDDTILAWQTRHDAGIAPGMEIKTDKTPATPVAA